MKTSKSSYGLLLGLALAMALGLWWLLSPQSAWACGGGVICVDANASGAANGLSWTDAYTNIQSALEWTRAHTTTNHEIWVAAGIYYPYMGAEPASNREVSFLISYDNVQLYGGFAGGETTRTQRDWIANPTILSGDIDANDLNSDDNAIAETWNNIVGNNAYHVLFLDGDDTPITSDTVIDGFIITAGLADADLTEHPHESGGGLYCGDKDCSPTLTNIIFSGNQGGWGAGLFIMGRGGVSNPTLTNVTFNGNRADYGGGGLAIVSFLEGGTGSPNLTNVIFSGNWGSSGGGIHSESSKSSKSNPVLTNVIFSGNQGNYGGGMNISSIENGESKPILTNVTFSGNQGKNFGGGIHNRAMGGGISHLNLVNSILWGNTADNNPQIYNSDGSTVTITYSDVEWPSGTYTGTGNINLDPQFVAPIAAGSTPTSTGNYRLQATSPAINAGNNLSVTVATDPDDNPRISGGTVDMGAYEFPAVMDTIVYLPLVIRAAP